MKSAKNACVLLATLLVASLSFNAKAEKITVYIEAEVTDVWDSEGVLQGKVNVGDIVVGAYTYESTTPDSNAAATVGDYWHTTLGYGIELNVNGFTFRTDPAATAFLVEVVNDHQSLSDNYLIRSYSNLFDISVPGSETDGYNSISWQLDDPSKLALDSDKLPTDVPHLSDWQSFFGLRIRSRSFENGEFIIAARVHSACAGGFCGN